jgi:putative membrane protein
MMGNYWFGGMGWIGMIIGLVITIAVIVGIVVLIVWSIQRSNGNSAQSGLKTTSSQSARDIAQARYAKGEINREEYQQILSDLGH